MLKVPLYEKLEYYQHEKDLVEKDLKRVCKLLDSIKDQRNKLLDQESDLYWKIEEIKEEIEKEEQ